MKHNLDVYKRQEVVCVGDLPESEELASICILAMRECLTNGVCHAGATELSIQMQNENHQYSICITNNGAAPDKEIVPKGGLYNISRHVFDLSLIHILYKKTRKSRVYRRKIKSIRRRRAGSLYRGILFQFTIVRY